MQVLMVDNIIRSQPALLRVDRVIVEYTRLRLNSSPLITVVYYRWCSGRCHET